MNILVKLYHHLTYKISQRKWWGIKESDPKGQASIQFFAIVTAYYLGGLGALAWLFEIPFFKYIFKFSYFHYDWINGLVRVILLLGIPSLFSFCFTDYYLRSLKIDWYSEPQFDNRSKVIIKFLIYIPLLICLMFIVYTISVMCEKFH